MILVTQAGNMSAVKILRETPKGFIYNDLSMNGSARTKERRIGKDELTRKLVSSTNEAFEWLGIPNDDD